MKNKQFIILSMIFLLGMFSKVFAQTINSQFKLAMVQMTVKGGERNTNIALAQKMIKEAAQNNADVVLLPEAMDLGWTDPTALTMAEPIPDGITCSALVKSAKENNVYVISGLVEKEGDLVYNSAVLINPEGEVILKHRKINEVDIGKEFYALGENLNVVDTEFGKIGLEICADAYTKDHSLSRALAHMGADVILSPCSWAMPAEHDNEKEPYGSTWTKAYSAVAKEFSIWIAGCSNVGWMTAGPWKGHKSIGNSLVMGPDGQPVLWGPYGVNAETILYIDIIHHESSDK